MGDARPFPVGSWELVARRDSGPGSEVWDAHGPDRGEVVLKLHAADAEAQGLAEASLLGLVHPGLACCIDVGRRLEDGRLYTVTERVLGGPLAVGSLVDASAEQAVAAAARLLAALQAVHGLGLLHRDLKPDNVFLERGSGRPVLLDFGLVVPEARAGAASLAGTPRAMAPELFGGRPASVAADLWAAGLLLAEALVDRPLVGSGSAASMAAERRALTPPALGSDRPPELVALLARLLDPAPERRPAHAAAALALLGPVADPADLAASMEAARSAAVTRADPRRAARLAALASGSCWVAPFGPAGPDGSVAVGAFARFAELARGLPAPSTRLSQHLDAQRRGPEQVGALARELAALRPLEVLAPETRDDDAAAVEQALADIPGLTLVRCAPPTAAAQLDVLTAWLGPVPDLARRLSETPVASWDDLAEALDELVRRGVVVRDAVGTRVDETRLSATWPLAAAELGVELTPSAEALLDLLCLAPRPLQTSELAHALGRGVADDLAELSAARLLSVRRAGERPAFAPRDGRLVRMRDGGGGAPDVRARLAVRLAPEGEPDEATAVALAGVLGRAEQAPAADDAAVTHVALAAAATLRRVGRLGLAEVLLDRAAAGAPVGGAERAAVLRERVDVLLRAGAFDRALARLDEADAERPGDPAFAMRRGRWSAQRGRLAEALERLESLDLGGLGHDDAMLALQTRAAVLQGLGRSEEGLTVLRDAMRLHGDRGDRRAMTMIERRGFLERDLGRDDEAVRSFERARAMAERLGHHALVWSPLYNIGKTIRDRGEKRRGLAIQEQAAEVCEATGNPAGLVTVLNSLGAGWLTLGQVDRARGHLARALALCRGLGNRRAEAMVQNNTGEAFAAEGRHDEAEGAWAASLALRVALQDRQGQAAVHLTRGPARLRRGDAAGASRDLASARACLDGLDAAWWQVRADLLEARLALREGDVEGAGAAAGRAASRAREHGFAGEALQARALACRCGRDDLADLDPDPDDPGPWHAEAFIARASRPDVGCADADADVEKALAILAGAPDGPLEAEALLLRLTRDLDDLQAAWNTPDPEVGRVGRLLSRVTRDLDRARELVDRHGPPDARRRVDDLAGRFAAMDDQQDVSGLAGFAQRLVDLERLAEINKRLSEERDTQALLDLIIDSAIELTGAARGFLILFDGRAESFRAARHIDESTITDPQFQVSHSVARQVVREGRPLLTANAVDDPRLTSAASISELKLLSILCVPLAWRGRVQGAVYLDHPQVVGRFEESHLQTVLSLAEQAAIALANARLAEGLASSNQELEAQRAEVARLNEALRERLERREAELEEARESLDASRRTLGLRYDYSSIVTRSRAMHDVLDLLDHVTDTAFPVVIQGESGTGKELLARAIHFNGPRKERNYLSINCAAIPEQLIESELFGSRRGAFSGADRDRKGLFVQADGGTLFLDEIGDMSLDVQKRLLRVLQEGEVLPLGSDEVVRVDVRILCATHRDLALRVTQGLFREDLYYRLVVARVALPPLRDRPEDLALLLPHFLERHGGRLREVDPEALALLESRPWPGNVREFENFVMNLVMFDREGERLTVEGVRRVLGDQLPPGGLPQVGAPTDGAGSGGAGRGVADYSRGSLSERQDAFERDQILRAVADSGGNKSAAADVLGIPVRSLYKRIKRLWPDGGPFEEPA